MTLVTRGLGKKVTAGTIATLVTLGLGLTVITPPVGPPVTPPSVVQPSAGFLLDGPIISVIDHLRPHKLKDTTLIDISITGSSDAIIHHVLTSDFILVNNLIPHTYKLSTNLEISEIKLSVDYTYNNYYDKLIEIEDEALILGKSFLEIDYSSLILSSHQINNNIDINYIGEFNMTGTELQKQIIEEEELLLFS